MDPMLLVRSLQQFKMPVKSFEFREKARVREKTVDDADRIIPVQSGQKILSRFFNGSQVPRSNIPGSSN
jgi:hypothetical protein